jgi:glycosyltransferase involved in cell wall biosynthesis
MTKFMQADHSRKLHVLYHHRTQGRGAEGVHITSIVRSMEAMGHKVTVLSPPGIDPMNTAGNAPVDKSNVKTTGINSFWKFVSKNLPNFMFELAEIGYNIPAMRRLEKELASSHYDMIYERYAFYMIAGAHKARKYKIPFVLEANEVNGIKDRARKQSFPWLCGMFERFIFKRCTSIHTVSSYLKNMIVQQGVKADQVVVAPNAVDPKKFSGVKHSGELRKQYGLEGKKIIGFAGWFDHWDRLDLLIDVFIKIRQDFPDTALLLIGDDKVLQTVRDKAKQAGIEQHVILTGPVKRDVVHQYLSLLDMAVFTHSNEFGSPVVMFEFMGLKIPVVAPRLLPITDVLTDNENALLFDVLNMEQMEAKIRLMLNDAAMSEKLAARAYEKLMAHHTWDNNARDIIHSAGLG